MRACEAGAEIPNSKIQMHLVKINVFSIIPVELNGFNGLPVRIFGIVEAKPVGLGCE